MRSVATAWFVLLTQLLLGLEVGGQFNEPEGKRRDQTFRVLEFEHGTVNQRFEGTLRYYCTFRGKWSKARHPADFPRNPSYSAPVIISHSNGYRMWTGTEACTLGVESLAEVSVVRKEVSWRAKSELAPNELGLTLLCSLMLLSLLLFL